MANSSQVMEQSPSPSFYSFSLEASKSGFGRAGEICSKEGWSWETLLPRRPSSTPRSLAQPSILIQAPRPAYSLFSTQASCSQMNPCCRTTENSVRRSEQSEEGSSGGQEACVRWLSSPPQTLHHTSWAPTLGLPNPTSQMRPSGAQCP